MKVERYIISLAKASKPSSIKELDENVIATLKTHQRNGVSQQSELTVYCSQKNLYNSMYSGEVLTTSYKNQVEEQIRTVLRALGLRDVTYKVNVEYHPNAVW